MAETKDADQQALIGSLHERIAKLELILDRLARENAFPDPRATSGLLGTRFGRPLGLAGDYYGYASAQVGLEANSVEFAARLSALEARVEAENAEVLFILSQSKAFAKLRFHRVSEVSFYTPDEARFGINLLEAMIGAFHVNGLHPVPGGITEYGSLMRRFFAKSTEAVTSAEAKTIYKKTGRAIELAMIDKVQAETNEINSRAIANMVLAHKDVPNYVLVTDAFVAVKVTTNGEARQYLEQLSDSQRDMIKNNPGLKRDVAAMEAALFGSPSRAAIAAQGSLATEQDQEDEPPPPPKKLAPPQTVIVSDD